MRLAFKAALMVILTLAILIPLQMIRGTIHDRQQYREAAVRDIGTSFGGPQVLAGPVLVVPYEERVVETASDEKGEHRTVRRTSGQWTFFPDTLSINGALKPDVRRRGLHQVRVYEWDGTAAAQFDVTVPNDDGSEQRTIGQPWLSLGIADVGGLRGTPQLTVNGAQVVVQQGIGHADGAGVHARLTIPAAGARLHLDVRAALHLRGTETFAMQPLGTSNDLRLQSSWLHPKFDGKSPQQDLDGSGFRARWQIAAVATNAQRLYRQNPLLISAQQPAMSEQRALEHGMSWTQPGDTVRVSLIDPVNPYLQADRATKYGLLFVLLTFVGFFMFELIKRVRVHPIQYLLVGLAIAIFFLLLVSLSEHIDFGLSYLLAVLGCIGLIGFYLAAVLRSTAHGLGFAMMLGTLYAALYGLLLSEDNALVLGAGLLFVILAAIMVITRKVDWYQVAARQPGAATEIEH